MDRSRRATGILGPQSPAIGRLWYVCFGRSSGFGACCLFLHMLALRLLSESARYRPIFCHGKRQHRNPNCKCRTRRLCSRFWQAGWWLVFGVRGFVEARRVYSGQDADCFWNLGAYQVCDATQRLSIFSSLVLLMAQAMVTRILVPGISNFVNASVRRMLRCLTSDIELWGAPVSHATDFALCRLLQLQRWRADRLR